NESHWSDAQRKAFLIEARAGLAAAFESRGMWEAAAPHLRELVDLGERNQVVLERMTRALFRTGSNADRIAAVKRLQIAAAADDTLPPPEVTIARIAGELCRKEPDAALYTIMAEDFFAAAFNHYKKNPKKLVLAHQAYGGWMLDVGNLEAATQAIGNAEK